MDKKKYYPLEPNYAVPPGEILLDALEMRGISQARFASLIGVSTNTMSRLVRGESAMTSDMALRIERALDIPASLWMNAETNYQLCKKRREEREALEERRDLLKRPPIKEAIKRRYFEPSVDELLRFFRVQNPESLDKIASNPTFALRCSGRASCDPLALATWLQMGTIEAEKFQIALYDERAFRDSLDKIRKLTILEPSEYVPRAKEICASCGVALVLVKEFPKVAASGAARLITPQRGAILLNLRGKRADCFWFTFFHEAYHVWKWKKRTAEWRVDCAEDYGDEEREDEEKRADEFASEILIPKKFEKDLHLKSEQRIVAFAQRIGVHPGIVVGRMQHRGIIEHNRFNNLKQKIDWNLIDNASS